MKIINKGKDIPEKIINKDVYEIKCDRCGCVFEAEYNEFYSQCGLHCVWCPNCGRELDSYRWEYCNKKTVVKTIKTWD